MLSKEYLPSADGRTSRRRNVLKGDVHVVGGETHETDPVRVGTVTVRRAHKRDMQLTRIPCKARRRA